MADTTKETINVVLTKKEVDKLSNILFDSMIELPRNKEIAELYRKFEDIRKRHENA